MSLFLVNRYLGDEEDESVSKASQAQALLRKLQQKAKDKQQQNVTETNQEEGQHLAEKPREKADVKKKRKTQECGGEETQKHKKRKSEADDQHQDPVQEKVKKKKKKKKDLKEKQKKEQSGKDAADSCEADEGPEATGGDEAAKPTTENVSAPTGFTVLGGFQNKPVQKVQRVLPQWLAQPDVIHRDVRTNLVPVSDVSALSTSMMKKLQHNGIHHFFPVQAEVIPAILDSVQQSLLIGRGGYRPRDICVSAPTGSGKTLAFVIPVVQALMQRVVCEVRALAVLPTKELAQQVGKVFTSYTEGSSLRVVMLTGQRSLAAEQDSLSEYRGGRRCSLADIVVATPGRLVDHINKNSGLCLDHLRFLIIDEADRMIDSMHQSWLRQVVEAVYRTGSGPGPRSLFRRTQPAHITAASLSPPQMPLQKLLFSATLTQNPEKLQQLGLHQPRLFSSAHNADAAKQDRFDFPQGLTEFYVPCTLSKKPLLILHFILRMKLRPLLCFTNSRETAHRLYLLLQLFGGVQAAEFSSRLTPGERKKTLKEFEQGKIQLLISTDAAARGIDIDGVKCVVNYDAPQFIRTYVHRIGRTARAGRAGLAFTFLLGVQEKNFLRMVEDAGSPGIQKQIIKPQNLKSMEDRYQQTLQQLANVIKDEKGK